MIQEDKHLLLVDLCARLPYNIMVDYENHIYVLNEIDPACKDIDYITVRIQDIERLMSAKNIMIENIKPYLRPMSSMTEEEKKELWELLKKLGMASDIKRLDWLNAHHFDYRGLIEKGLALEAPKGMYN
jgi:hypothetical protein